MREPITPEEGAVRPSTSVGPAGCGVGSPAAGLPAPQPATPARPPCDLSMPPRLRTADRQQLLSPMTIEDLLEADHPARAVWRFAESLDLTVMYDRIRA